MTVESEVATLTLAVDNLTSTVNVSKTNLDVSVANALASAGTASDHKTGALEAKTAAETARDLAYAHSQSAAAAGDYQSMKAVDEDIAGTAVDVFVYDTSKDSDGGQWRKRCQHTSWYNETLNTSTRGATKEFPAVAVLVAEADKVTIYDGDDPAMPMWMVFNQGIWHHVHTSGHSLTSVSMLNGKLCWAGFRLGRIDFIKDAADALEVTWYNTFTNPISGRNTQGINAVDIYFDLVNSTVHDIAMTVLPSAPIDPATGLPV
ncbi:MAG: hypothetical protein GY881_12630, partial [Gammaproteobacteria bacterium]|nr:hypothetical protein [Gammaproteobacteria bacterium]